MVAVEVEAGWGDPDRTVLLTTLVGAPPQTLGSVVVTVSGGSGTPVPRDQTIDHTAVLLDDAGQPIPDVTFSWGLVPTGVNPGNGNPSARTRQPGPTHHGH